MYVVGPQDPPPTSPVSLLGVTVSPSGSPSQEPRRGEGSRKGARTNPPPPRAHKPIPPPVLCAAPDRHEVWAVAVQVNGLPLQLMAKALWFGLITDLTSYRRDYMGAAGPPAYCLIHRDLGLDKQHLIHGHLWDEDEVSPAALPRACVGTCHGRIDVNRPPHVVRLALSPSSQSHSHTVWF